MQKWLDIRDTFGGANLKIKVEFPNYLSSRRAVDGDRIDGEVFSLESPSRGCLDCDHGYQEWDPWI